jgi:hypothetical protein
VLLCLCHHNTFELAVATEEFIRKCPLDCGCAHTKDYYAIPYVFMLTLVPFIISKKNDELNETTQAA